MAEIEEAVQRAIVNLVGKAVFHLSIFALGAGIVIGTAMGTATALDALWP